MLITVTIGQEGQWHQEMNLCTLMLHLTSQLLCSGLIPRPSGSGDETTSVVEMLLHSIVYGITLLLYYGNYI